MNGRASTWSARPRTPGIAAVGAALLGTFLWLGFATAQELEEDKDCRLVGVGGYTDSRRQDSVNYRHHATGGIDYQCTDGTRIRSDSAVVWERSGNAFFYGNVHFEDPDTELSSDSARYFDNIQELIAYGTVVLTDRKGGAVIRGETLSYLSDSRFRKEDRILVYGGSPRATVYPARRPATPVATAEAEEDGEPGEAEEAVGDSLTDEAANPEEEGGPVVDSLGGEVVEATDDSIAGELAVVVDSLGDEVMEAPADSIEGETVPAVDSLGGEAPSVGAGELPELARLDSLVGIDAEPSDEAGAETEEDPPADAPVDSVTPLPYQVEAPRIMIDGRRFFRAGGGITVTRDSLEAVGDSLDYDQEVGAMLIVGDASVEDSGFRLMGLTVSMTPTAGLNEEILAREEARLTGDDVVMTAPAIRLFLEDSKVGRLVALSTVPPFAGQGAEEVDTTGLTPGDAARIREMAEAAAEAAEAADSLEALDSLPRPSVIAAEFNLTGDSIEVLSPGQVLDEVTAVGAARADAMTRDSLPGDDLPEIARNDWMEGETIIARFVKDGPTTDSAGAATDPANAGSDSTVAASDSTASASDAVVPTADSTDGPSDSGATRVRLETLTAVSDARSLYRLYRADTAGVEDELSGTGPDSVQDDSGVPPEPPPDTGSLAAGDDPDTPEDPDPAVEASESPAEGDDSDAAQNGQAQEDCDTAWADGERPPELHYVSGDQITIFLEGRKVVKMEVSGQTQGYHFEPVLPDCEPAAGDSAAVATDSLSTQTDTATISPDTVTTSDTTTTVPVVLTAHHPPSPTRFPCGDTPGHALATLGLRHRPHTTRRAGEPT